MSDRPALRSKRHRIRWMCTFLVLVLLLTAWRWSQPPVMRLVQCIPLGTNPVRFAHLLPSRTMSLQLRETPAPGKVIVLGADMRPRWGVKVPAWPEVKKKDALTNDNNEWETALSPNGRVLALARKTGDDGFSDGHKLVRVWSWRDGRALGEAHFTWIDSAFTTRLLPFATNDGRVWIGSRGLNGTLTQYKYHWWAITGDQVAHGISIANIQPYDDWGEADISPDGTAMLISNRFPKTCPPYPYDGDYATIRVCGHKVLFNHHCTAKISGGSIWCDSRTLLDEAGMRLGPNGMVKRRAIKRFTAAGGPLPSIIARNGSRGHLCITPVHHAHPWEAPTHAQEFIAYNCTPDGRVVVALEIRTNRYNRVLATLAQLPLIGQWIPSAQGDRVQLAVYAAPGCLQGILPLEEATDIALGSHAGLLLHGECYRIVNDTLSLSPDGRRVIFEGETAEGKRAQFIYAL